jgi:RNA polymerase sigma factor (sigma-70 family)
VRHLLHLAEGSALVDIPATDHSLLLALQSQSPARREAAWALFEPRYRPVIHAWCRRRHLPVETARELTQEILLKLSVQFLRHYYDPDRGRLRSWPKTVVENVLTDYARAQQRHLVGTAVGGTDHGRMLAELASPEAAEQLSDAVARQPVTRAAQAIGRVRARVPEAHWRAFWLKDVEERPAAEVAAEVGLRPANVYKISQRISKQLEEEIRHG